MTCVVASIENNKCMMGVDSCATAFQQYIVSPTNKIFKKNEMLIGMCDSYRMMNLMHIFDPPPKSSLDNYTYLIKIFVPTLKKMLEKNGENSETLEMLIGFPDQIFEINNDFSVIQNQPWGASVGSGKMAALGSLFTTKNMDIDHYEKIYLALQSSEATTNTVRDPFYILEI